MYATAAAAAAAAAASAAAVAAAVVAAVSCAILFYKLPCFISSPTVAAITTIITITITTYVNTRNTYVNTPSEATLGHSGAHVPAPAPPGHIHKNNGLPLDPSPPPSQTHLFPNLLLPPVRCTWRWERCPDSRPRYGYCSIPSVGFYPRSQITQQSSIHTSANISLETFAKPLMLDLLPTTLPLEPPLEI